MNETSWSAQVDPRRLRATLRLCFDGEQADALAAQLVADEPDSVHALESVVRAARSTFTTGRLLSVVKRSPTVTAPLRPRLGLSAVSALALAFHLGLDLDIGPLTRLFHTSAEQISVAIERGRQAVDRTYVAPCPEFEAAIGRYRDPSRDRQERLRLLQHLQSCERCQIALDRARQTDDDLMAAVNQAEDGLVSTAMLETKPAVRFAPVLLWGGGAVLVLLLALVGVAVSHRLFAHTQPPIPVRAANAPQPPFNGWLLETSSSGNVEAVNLATGVHRLLIHGDPTSTTTVMISPDKQHIAEMTYNQQQLGQTLRIYSIDGTQEQIWTQLDQTGQYQMDGWLSANQLMVQRLPPTSQGETQTSIDQQNESNGVLLAFDARNGTQQILFHGWVDSATASPNGSYVALGHTENDGYVTLELRPLQNNQLGNPIASVPHMIFTNSKSPVLWTPDGNHVIFWARGVVNPTTKETPIDLMTLSGQITTLYQTPGNSFGSLLNVSPDGSYVIYAEGTTGTASASWSYWRLDTTGGQPQRLLDGGDLERVLPAQRGWSSIAFATSPAEGSLMLVQQEPFLLPRSQRGSLQTGNSYATLAFDASGKLVGTVLAQFIPLDPLVWLPDSALSPRTIPTTVNTSPFHQLSGPVIASSLTIDSRVSPDGSKALVTDSTQPSSMAIDLSVPDGQSQPKTAGAPNDPSWLPDSSGVIGVESRSVSNGSVSRISIYGEIGTGRRGSAGFDPAQLGDDVNATYRYPMLAPNGLSYSFFVVKQQNVTLWVAGDNKPSSVVASWNVPSDAKVQQPLIAEWVDNDTLIFVEPDTWTKGYPQRVSLKRVTLTADGSTQVNSLISWQARGGEKGLTLQELRLSPDGTQLATRLRRFTGTNLTTDRFDAITVASVSDLSRSVEIARGTYGDGMSWSPDGTEIAAFIKGGLQVISSDGRIDQQVDTNGVSAAYPLWVRSNEIWYQATSLNGKPLHATLGATR